MRDRRFYHLLALLVLLFVPVPAYGMDFGEFVKQLTEYLQRLFNSTALPLVRRFERPTENPLAEWI